MDDHLPEPWISWAGRRPAPRVLHLDTAAAGRTSTATLEAVAAHARLEAEVGAYVAEQQATEQIEAGRADLAALLGLPAAGVAFVESASAGRAALLECWPLPPDAVVGVLAAEWGPNLDAFAARGLRPVELAADGAGRIDLGALERRLASDPPALVHLTQVTSHRGLVQPVAEAARICRAGGVPLWVDAAQALGHVDTATGADAVFATSRKWLTGPRGVGLVGVAERHWDTLRVHRSAMAGPDLPPVRYLESHEAHVAGRIGLATAVREFCADGPDRVAARLDEVGRLARAALRELPGWQVVDPDDAGGAVAALRPAAGQDAVTVRARLLAEHGVLITACLPPRAPREMREPLLRVSPHVDLTVSGLRRLCDGLRNF